MFIGNYAQEYKNFRIIRITDNTLKHYLTSKNNWLIFNVFSSENLVVNFFKHHLGSCFGSRNLDFGVGTHGNCQLFGRIHSCDLPLICSFNLTLFIKCKEILIIFLKSSPRIGTNGSQSLKNTTSWTV